ncbi:hypothetical protein L228DRAFT_226149 [Xylona heveae TC161]|uniref:D-serine dehydratase-like domain-containing protein n=1 Tax=Xylona heveae (strain CBS 132557 / TC161) TaxID=1328760 RepID=A0A165JKB5_XYLHT|nr:hypothetical protein L228DRAFT_226149 [Xylona heveae TC161]KZF26342.1 hypothetical protein L228DRAFT_226149 [Xylona heveae TC161]
MSNVSLYPGPTTQELKERFVGQLLQDVDGPAAIIDTAVAQRNCALMLDAAKALGVKFRAHVKTHKTTELTRFQVGNGSDPVNLVVSTLIELEQLVPFLLESKENGRAVNTIYGLPVQPSSIKRLAAIGKTLGAGSISVLVDNPEILPFLGKYKQLCGHTCGIYIKLDTGYNRAGIAPESAQLKELLHAILEHETKSPSEIKLEGFYSHMGTSYGSDSISQALDWLVQEIDQSQVAADLAKSIFPDTRRFVITVGATPTTTAAQNLTSSEPSSSSGPDSGSDSANAAVVRTKELIERVKRTHDVELHAGAYTTLDLQQLAAHARSRESNLSFNDIALRVLVEVASLYPHRSKPEALISCGSLGLGREPCRSYPGWGVVTPWSSLGGSQNDEQKQEQEQGQGQGQNGWYDPEDKDRTGWIVNRISQEHGVLGWEGPREKMRQLQIGEKLLLWPNHCCIAGAGYGYYLVVDSTRPGIEKDRVVDVWTRWRGW